MANRTLPKQRRTGQSDEEEADSDREQPRHSDGAHERYQEAWARLPPEVIGYLEDQEIADPERIANAACPTTVGTNAEGNFTTIPAEIKLRNRYVNKHIRAQAGHTRMGVGHHPVHQGQRGHGLHKSTTPEPGVTSQTRRSLCQTQAKKTRIT